MNWFTDLITNPFLLTSISGWAVAQVLKVIKNAVVNKKFDWKRLFGDGGMPSGHSATVSSLACITGLVYGTSSFEFAFTTILGWDYYSERCLEYLTSGKMKAVKVYRWLYILAVFIGPYMTVKAVWTIADIFNGLMAIPNMIALFVLSGVVAKETKDFFDSKKHLNK